MFTAILESNKRRALTGHVEGGGQSLQCDLEALDEHEAGGDGVLREGRVTTEEDFLSAAAERRRDSTLVSVRVFYRERERN